ncbi:MAG: TraR/DksA C4-type zinc finger protein [Acidimicrobiia bacterium]|nr:TraR/DksA C4-type zinc finger protein [Acidimicrobiia bacterium]
MTTKKTSSARSGGATKGKAKAAAVDSPFTAEFLATQRERLEAERIRYVRSADALKAEADSLANEREPGDVQFDEESGEGDTLAVERERDLALSAQARAAVEAIDAALARMEAGTYGICIHSGEPIPVERLEAIPWALEKVEFKVGSFRS